MSDFPKRNSTVLPAVALLVILGAVSIALLWFGLAGLRKSTGSPAAADEPPVTSAPIEATAAATLPAALPAPQVMVVSGEDATSEGEAPAEPTDAPLDEPTATDAPPTEEPPAATETAAMAMITAGSAGVYVRSGPGVNYTQIDALAPDQQAEVTGQYGEWWQITLGGRTGWVYGGAVTASDTYDVPQVQPPAAPTAVPTAVPPTPTPKPQVDTRGIIVNSYWVEGAPGPYGVNQAIWFNWDMTSTTGSMAFEGLGTWVKETGQFQVSWRSQTGFPATHRDHIDIPAAGTYSLYLRICFSGSDCVNLAGPVTVNVQ